MINVVFEMERLLVRAATANDVELLYTLWTDPQVMQYVGFPQGLRITKDEVLAQIERDYPGPWEHPLVVVNQQTGASIGQCKMHHPDNEGVANTDVKLLPAFWGHKYGVEIKRALVDYLFTHTDCVAVQGSPNVKNIASIKMQEAVGGVRVREEVYEFPESMRDYTTPVHAIIYHVRREDWEAKR